MEYTRGITYQGTAIKLTVEEYDWLIRETDTMTRIHQLDLWSQDPDRHSLKANDDD